MSVHCRRCGSEDVRLSHFQLEDVLFLLLLRYPVRCLDCSERGYYNFSALSGLRRATTGRRKLAKQPKST
jgi:hypothetical protein